MIGPWDILKNHIPVDIPRELSRLPMPTEARCEDSLATGSPLTRMTRICQLLARAAEARELLLAEADKLELALAEMVPPRSPAARPAYDMAREGLVTYLEAVDWMLESWGQEPGEFAACLATLVEGDRLLDRAEGETEQLECAYPLVA